MTAFENDGTNSDGADLRSMSTGGRCGFVECNAAETEFGILLHKLSPEQLRQLRPHPSSRIFPVLKADIDRMRKSLEEDGQQHPITLDETGKLIRDGNCRAEAAIKLDMPLVAVLLANSDLNGLEAEEWVFHRNRSNEGGRRLTDSQLAIVAVRSNYAVAKRHAAARKTAGVLAGSDKGAVAKTIADQHGLKANRCKQAISVITAGDERLEELVYEGKLSISKGAMLAALPSDERDKAINAALIQKPSRNQELKCWSDVLRSLKSQHASLQKLTKRMVSILKAAAETGAAQEPFLHRAVQYLDDANYQMKQILEEATTPE